MRIRLLFCLCVSLLARPAVAADDQPVYYPEKTVTIIVPFAAGGGLDLSVRLLAKYAAPKLGVPVEVVNLTRGGNIRGNMEGIQAYPDGYTLLAWGSGLFTDDLLVRNAPYTYEDVEPVCGFMNDPEIFVADRIFAERRGVATFTQLLDYVRDNPGQVTIGMGGNWTAHDLFRLRIERVADVRFNRMPFLGGRLALEAVAKGNANVANCFAAELVGLPDRMRENVLPLAVASEEPLPILPDVPSVVELGYPNMAQSMWRMITAPRGTDPAIVAKLESVVREVLQNPMFHEEATRMGFFPVFMGADEMAVYLKESHARAESLLTQYGAIGVKEVE
ncbi:MAG: tripartite tricarboxylate transporter substrate binding protein [Planctomycetaceae bacterium]|nr:tripartite tricarboxylate transporter substrate binding protein [Planctomycetaceae bacterium]